MEIIRTMRDLTKKELYHLTMSDTNISMKDIEDGEVLQVSNFAIYTDINSDGEEQTLLSMQTDKGYVATNSATFRRNFEKIADLFDGEETLSIKKISGQTKAGRPFVNCTLAD